MEKLFSTYEKNLNFEKMFEKSEETKKKMKAIYSEFFEFTKEMEENYILIKTYEKEENLNDIEDKLNILFYSSMKEFEKQSQKMKADMSSMNNLSKYIKFTNSIRHMETCFAIHLSMYEKLMNKKTESREKREYLKEKIKRMKATYQSMRETILEETMKTNKEIVQTLTDKKIFKNEPYAFMSIFEKNDVSN